MNTSRTAATKNHFGKVSEMLKKEYRVENLDISVTVWETKRQKDLLDVLDELLENDKLHPENNVFEDMAFFISYKDGSYYSNIDGDAQGIYKKKSIIYIRMFICICIIIFCRICIFQFFQYDDYSCFKYITNK